MTRSAGSSSPSTSSPVARPASLVTASTCPGSRVRPGVANADARNAVSNVSRRQRIPMGSSLPSGNRRLTGSAPEASSRS